MVSDVDWNAKKSPTITSAPPAMRSVGSRQATIAGSTPMLAIAKGAWVSCRTNPCLNVAHTPSTSTADSARRCTMGRVRHA